MFNDKYNKVYLVPVPIMVEYTDNTRYGDSDRGIGSRNKEEHMSDNFTKTELEALLRANKAEVDVVAATMKKDMAEWREQQNVQLANLNATMQALSSKIDGKMDSVDGKLEAIQGKIDGKLEGMQGKIDGINTAISGIQSGLSTKLTFFGITITVVIALVGIAIGMINKNTEPTYQHKPTVTQSQPAEPSH
ncbi:hypothetical protein, partial [Xenorhabdus anantnagensis]